ncbi:MAG: hypothetical protein JO115_04065 [Pseudonocardiales bacterium]|nr:hypothetical protein [Pseudonocardiales bacterium]
MSLTRCADRRGPRLIVCRHEQNAACSLASVTKFAAEITAQRTALREIDAAVRDAHGLGGRNPAALVLQLRANLDDDATRQRVLALAEDAIKTTNLIQVIRIAGKRQALLLVRF